LQPSAQGCDKGATLGENPEKAQPGMGLREKSDTGKERHGKKKQL
jgi:hypothetical protein